MATLLFSTLSGGSTIAFDPTTDLLRFDDPALEASAVAVAWAADGTGVSFSALGKTVYLPPAASLTSLSSAHVVFANGSLLLVGDDSLAADDAAANTLTGTSFGDRLVGWGGADSLSGGAGADWLDGGAGADTMAGGLGGDTYVVDDPGDVVREAPVLVSSNAAGEGIWAAAGSIHGSFSADGRYVVFESSSDSLVAGDTNHEVDIFVKDLQTGAIQRVSTDAGGRQANGASDGASFSTDGRYVLFESDASNLVAADTRGWRHIFVKDLQTGAIRLVSTDAGGWQANDYSSSASFSADGGFVVFKSRASNLVGGDTNGWEDVFVKDLQSGAIQRVSTNASGGQGNLWSGSWTVEDRASFSADGRYVVFTSSASNLVVGDTNDTEDVFVKDLQTGAIQRVSTDPAGNQANNGSECASFSADGRHLVFASTASNLVAGDTNGTWDVFVKDLQTGAIQRVSTDASGGQANGQSGLWDGASFSADGRYVVFVSDASNLVAGDTNGWGDVFVKDLQTGAIQRVPMAGIAGPADYGSRDASFSADARYLVLVSANLLFCAANPFFDPGPDTVVASFSFTLPSGVEDLVLAGEGNVDGVGNPLGNTLIGNSGANRLDGNQGDDSLDGAGGNDLLHGDAGNDTLNGADGNDWLFGDNNNDSLVGGAGDDRLYGGPGADTMAGGDGSDQYFIDNSGDLVFETNGLAAGGTDLVETTLASYILGAHVENGRILATGSANLSGNALNNLLYAGTGNNVLDGGAGSDTVDWTYAVSGAVGVTASLASGSATGSGSDTLIGIEHLIGSANADRLTGDGNANSLSGVAGNDTLDGGAGADTLTGGDGSDHYYIDHLGDQVNESNATAAGGTDLVHTTLASHTLGNHVENGRILASGAANLTGNALNNLLYAGIGNNVLDGGAGSDTVTWAYGVIGASGVTASLASGSASGSGLDTLIGIEHLIGSPNADRLTGDGNANNLSGGLGNDTLDGGAGADTLTGGDGSDFYYIDHLGDQVIETNATAAGGTDLVHSTLATYTLGNHVENGRILASGAANLSGNALNNLLYAGTGNNLLDGGAGSDTVTWAYAIIGAVGVTATLASGTASGSGSDTLIGIEHLIGSANADRLTGDGNANNLSGGLGNDTLDGGGGADTLTGGDGSDHYYIDHLGDQVIETNAAAGGTDLVHSTLATYTLGNHVENGRILAAGAANLTGNALDNLLYAGTGNNVLDGGAGSDTVTWAYAVSGATGVTASLASGTASGGSGSDTLIGIEHLIGSANADRLTGDGNANQLSGGLGNDTLDGGAGADTLTGGDGSDHYYIDHLGDQVIETNAAAAGGTDLVHTTLASYTLGNHIENGRILAAGAANLTGNALNNLLYAGIGNNVLNGGAGSDTVTWAYAVIGAVGVTANLASGSATGSGSDTLISIEHLIGSANADRLTGDGNANSLSGAAGNDTLAGGLGNDSLVGGLGADFFRFDTLPDAVTNRDTIADFNVVDDTIQLENAVFTSLAATGTLTAGSFRSGAGFNSAADADDYLIYDSNSGALYYDANGNAGSGPVPIATLAAGLALANLDFVVT